MKMRALKQLSDKIRSDNEGKSRISWPESFKDSVVKELRQGSRVNDIIHVTGISRPTLMSWNSVKKSKRNNFKEIHVANWEG